ncbi:unnamed protein product [Paramecium sonneborni]|uniref:Uncharacterized protein n=1 Tax=Paramecium sonneborni TaxID=65129 RepID=A0A8S1Q052_9CILI|nr:unnamed protein product [Paramecium sonneborni]
MKRNRRNGDIEREREVEIVDEELLEIGVLIRYSEFESNKVFDIYGICEISSRLNNCDIVILVCLYELNFL